MSSQYDFSRPYGAYAPESNYNRSPSRFGQHPNIVVDDRFHNPQSMYDRPGQPPPKPVGAAKAPPPKEDFWGNVVLVGAALGLGYLIFSGDGDGDGEVRSNPSPEQPPQAPMPVATPSVVVVQSPSAPMPHVLQGQQPQHTFIQAPAPAPAPAQAPMSFPFQIPQLEMKESKEIKDTLTVEVEPKDKSRARKTTQARDEKGHYLPAGTRKRAVTEGKKK